MFYFIFVAFAGDQGGKKKNGNYVLCILFQRAKCKAKFILPALFLLGWFVCLF